MKLDVINEERLYKITGVDDNMNTEFYSKLISMGIGIDSIIYFVKSTQRSLVMFYIDNVKICLRAKDCKFIEVEEYNE